jgi:hypothetical protein
MSKLRAVAWSLAIAVIAVVVAAMLFRLIPGNGLVFSALLVLCVAFFAALLGIIAEVSPAIGAAAGVCAVALVAAVLGLTIAVAPLQMGAKRPGFEDLLWAPLLGLIAALVVCGAAGWFGALGGLRFARRRRAPP